MTTVLIVVHLMVVLALIGLVLLQRSEGGALGIGGGSGAFMSGRGAGNVLTRSTAILAAVFFLTSIGLTLLARMEAQPGDILDRLPAGTSAPVGGAPAVPAAPGSTEPPASAADLLNQLGGPSSGPQAPPASAGAPPAPQTAPPATEPNAATPQPVTPDAAPAATTVPAETVPPASEAPAAVAPTDVPAAPAPQAPAAPATPAP